MMESSRGRGVLFVLFSFDFWLDDAHSGQIVVEFAVCRPNLREIGNMLWPKIITAKASEVRGKAQE